MYIRSGMSENRTKLKGQKMISECEWKKAIEKNIYFVISVRNNIARLGDGCH